MSVMQKYVLNNFSYFVIFFKFNMRTAETWNPTKQIRRLLVIACKKSIRWKFFSILSQNLNYIKENKK